MCAARGAKKGGCVAGCAAHSRGVRANESAHSYRYILMNLIDYFGECIMYFDRRTRIAALEHEKTHQVMKDLAATSSLSRHGRFTYKYGQSSRPLTFSSGVCVFLFHLSFSTIADAYPRRSPYASIRHCSSAWHALRNQLTRVSI